MIWTYHQPFHCDSTPKALHLYFVNIALPAAERRLNCGHILRPLTNRKRHKSPASFAHKLSNGETRVNEWGRLVVKNVVEPTDKHA